MVQVQDWLLRPYGSLNPSRRVCWAEIVVIPCLVTLTAGNFNSEFELASARRNATRWLKWRKVQEIHVDLEHLAGGAPIHKSRMSKYPRSKRRKRAAILVHTFCSTLCGNMKVHSFTLVQDFV